MATKRFLLAIAGDDSDDTLKISEFLKTKKFFWAHYFKSWILVDRDGEYNTTTLREAIYQIIGGKETLVIQISSKSWSANVRTNGEIRKWMFDKFMDEEEIKLNQEAAKSKKTE
ncbi:hypothetical protein [Rurimicrobium arvi]|uniref:Uncharacterized protein n=1 Tax=Rurimicrobium arvi TaxID=2049916 RepID=A0ABP8MYM3_9BACT